MVLRCSLDSPDAAHKRPRRKHKQYVIDPSRTNLSPCTQKRRDSTDASDATRVPRQRYRGCFASVKQLATRGLPAHTPPLTAHDVPRDQHLAFDVAFCVPPAPYEGSTIRAYAVPARGTKAGSRSCSPAAVNRCCGPSPRLVSVRDRRPVAATPAAWRRRRIAAPGRHAPHTTAGRPA